MTVRKDNGPENRRGGGRKAAALFCLAALISVILAFALIRVLLGPRDRMARFVPGDAVIYIHAQGRKASSSVTGASAFIPENRANELGLFALDLDGGRIWTAALMWSRLAPPTDAEIASLELAGAMRIAPTFYLIRTGDGPVILSEGRDGSLAERPGYDRALTAMRGISRIQALIDTDKLVKSGVDNELFPVEAGPAVMALTLKDGKTSALVIPAAEAAKYHRFPGFRLPDDTADGRIPGMIGSGENGPRISLMTDKNDLNPIPMLFHEAERLRNEAGVPESRQLELARSLIAGHFSGPLSLTVWPHESGPDFAAFLPNAHPKDFEADVRGYLSASFPGKKTLNLPDGSKTTEFIIEPGRYELPVDGSPEGHNRIWSGYPISAFEGGTLMTSDFSVMNLIMAGGQNLSNQDRCVSGSWPTLIIEEPLELVPHSGNIWEILSVIPLKKIVIQKIGDNSMFFCGY